MTIFLPVLSDFVWRDIWCRINARCRFHINIVRNRYEVCAVLKNVLMNVWLLIPTTDVPIYARIMVWWISITVPINSGRCQWWLVTDDCLLLNWCVLGFERTQFWTIDFIPAVPRKNVDVSFIYLFMYVCTAVLLRHTSFVLCSLCSGCVLSIMNMMLSGWPTRLNVLNVDVQRNLQVKI